jgi:hypothetical protein
MSSLWIVLTVLLVTHQQLSPDFCLSQPCMLGFRGVRPGDASSLIFTSQKQLRLVIEGGVLLRRVVGVRSSLWLHFSGRNLVPWSLVPGAGYAMEEHPCQRRANGSVFVTRVRWQEPIGSPTSGLKPRIVVLGDSITKGVRPGVTAEETFAAVLQRRLLEQGLSYEVINRGIGGERTDQALKRLARMSRHWSRSW